MSGADVPSKEQRKGFEMQRDTLHDASVKEELPPIPLSAMAPISGDAVHMPLDDVG